MNQLAQTHISNALAKTIKDLRSKHEMSQGQLSKASGLSIDFISKLERGKRQSPTIISLFKLANGFGISATSLIAHVESFRSMST